MRILILVSDFPKVTETFVLANAMHFLSAGHDLSIFHLKPFRHGEIVHAHAQPAIACGFTFGWFDTDSAMGVLWAFGRPARFMPLLIEIVTQFWSEPRLLAATLAILPKSCALGRWAAAEQVGHMHAEFAGYPATAAWIASTLSGVPFSFSAHAHDIFLSQLGLVRKAQDAAFVRTISEFNRRFLAALPGFPAEKISVMRCGVELCKPAPVPPRAGTTADPWRLLFVGALLPRKGVDDLIAAVALLPETLHWRLDIIGGGRLEQALRNQVRALGLAQVAFHGAQPAQTVGAAMQAAHLVVVPSKVGDGGRSEGIPVVLMEALAQARPVVASRLSGIPELIKDGITGRLCRPGSPSELAQTITETLGDWPGALEMGARGRDRVVRDYDITQNAQALLDKITSEPAPC